MTPFRAPGSRFQGAVMGSFQYTKFGRAWIWPKLWPIWYTEMTPFRAPGCLKQHIWQFTPRNCLTAASEKYVIGGRFRVPHSIPKICTQFVNGVTSKNHANYGTLKFLCADSRISSAKTKTLTNLHIKLFLRFRIIHDNPRTPHKSIREKWLNWSVNCEKMFFTFSDQFDHFQETYTPKNSSRGDGVWRVNMNYMVIITSQCSFPLILDVKNIRQQHKNRLEKLSRSPICCSLCQEQCWWQLCTRVQNLYDTEMFVCLFGKHIVHLS